MIAQRLGRARLVGVAAIGMVVVGLLTFAYLPRSVASGGPPDDRWEIRAAPGIVSPRISVHTDAAAHSLGGFGGPPAGLEATRIVSVEGGETTWTVVAGPTPRDVDSVRHTLGGTEHGEARIVRLGWRRVHLSVLEGPVEVTQLTAIGARGEVLATVAPETAPDTAPDTASE